MDEYAQSVSRIQDQFGISFRKASQTDLASLEPFGLPESLNAFFAEHEPSSCIDGPRRLWPITEVVRENTDFVPGCYLINHGYFVFATNISGDPCCFDLNDKGNGGPRIVQFWHDDSHEAMSPEQVHAIAQPIAANLLEFLQLYAEDRLD